MDAGSVKDVAVLVLALSTTSAFVTRLLIALYQVQQDIPRVVGATAALCVGVAVAILYEVGSGAKMTAPLVAVAVLAGIIAAAEAEGLGAVQQQAHRASMRRAMRATGVHRNYDRLLDSYEQDG